MLIKLIIGFQILLETSFIILYPTFVSHLQGAPIWSNRTLVVVADQRLPSHFMDVYKVKIKLNDLTLFEIDKRTQAVPSV